MAVFSLSSSFASIFASKVLEKLPPECPKLAPVCRKRAPVFNFLAPESCVLPPVFRRLSPVLGIPPPVFGILAPVCDFLPPVRRILAEDFGILAEESHVLAEENCSPAARNPKLDFVRTPLFRWDAPTLQWLRVQTCFPFGREPRSSDADENDPRVIWQEEYVVGA